MSILAGITQGRTQSGLRIAIAGAEKMGKTTLASMAPGSLLIPLEVGFAGIGTPKTGMLQTLAELHQFIQEVWASVQAKTFPFKTLVFDSATALERLIHNAVIERDPAYKKGGKNMTTMESAHGGYGRAHSMANDELDVILKWFDVLAVQGGLNIVLTCHVFSSKVIDPTSGEYDTWDLLLHSPKNNKTYGKREMITQWADIVGFLYEPMFVSKNGNMAQAVSQNKGRVLGLSRTPAYVAGNRLGIIGEHPIPGPPANGWNVLAHVIYEATGKTVDVFTR